MSEAVSALQGAAFEGLVTVRDTGPRGMITVRGDLSSAAMKKAVKAAVGTDVPAQRAVVLDGDRGAAWMSPDELLLMLPHGEAGAAVTAAEKALGKAHALVVDVSDARAVLEIEGASVREVLAKLAPVDLHPDAFGQGMIRRTHLAQVAAAFWMTGAESFEIVCFRSVAQYVFDLLSAAAAEGSDVGAF
jgi:sarcosine oxidase subunit gamma